MSLFQFNLWAELLETAAPFSEHSRKFQHSLDNNTDVKISKSLDLKKIPV